MLQLHYNWAIDFYVQCIYWYFTKSGLNDVSVEKNSALYDRLLIWVKSNPALAMICMARDCCDTIFLL